MPTVSDISPALIVNERESYSQYLWKLPNREAYIWDSKITYRFASGATPVDGQGVSLPRSASAIAANSQTSEDQFLWKLKDREVYVWDSRVAYRWAIGSTPVAGYPQPPARKTKEFPDVKNSRERFDDFLWLIPITGVKRWDHRDLYMNTMHFTVQELEEAGFGISAFGTSAFGGTLA